NMKMMLNGALTIATLDGANVEITEKVGEENIFLFGLTTEEVYEYYEKGNYQPEKIYEENEEIRKVLDKLIDGSIPDIKEEGRVIYNSLVHHDEYFILKDFTSYVDAHQRADELYQDKQAWNRVSLWNIASAGPFSSDYTIQQYAKKTWKI